MPNIKSRKKRSITNIKRNAAAKAQKSELKTLIKNVLKAVEASDKEAAVLAYNEVSSKLDKSITSNLHHKNYVSRQKARLSKAVNNVQ